MERIKVFEMKKGFIQSFIGFGILFFLFGMSLLIYSMIDGFKTEFLGGFWNHIIYLSQGMVFIFIGYSILKREKYYIEWNDEELRYLLPNNNFTVTIKLSEIKEVEIQLFEIKISVHESDKLMNLENVGFKDLRKIKGKLEEIKKATERNY